MQVSEMDHTGKPGAFPKARQRLATKALSCYEITLEQVS